MFPPSTSDGQSGFRRSNCLRRAFNSFYRPQSQPPTRRPMNPPPPPNRTSKKPSPFIDYRTLSRIFRRKNLSSVKEGFSIQQCASVLLPITFSALLIVICVVAALALLTDGFALCHCGSKASGEDREVGANETGLCLTNECIRKAHYLLERIDHSIQPCENFYHFACGRFQPISSLDRRSKFESELRSKLEQRPRPSFPLPYRLLFDFYDSCTNEEPQEQLATQPFNTLISRLGGWALLQNAKFDPENFEWETLEQQLYGYGVDGLFAIRVDASTNMVSLKSPQFLLATYRRQGLEEYFGRLLAELDVDDELSLKAVQEALDLESNLIDPSPPKPLQKLTLQEMKERYPKIQWDKFVFPLAELKDQQQMELLVQTEYLERVQSQLGGEKQSTANYLMLRLLHSVSAHLPRRYRAVRERLENKFEPRWQVCFEEMMDLMPLPLYGFGLHLQQQQQEGSGLKKLPHLIAKSKEQVGKQLRQLPWLDPKTKERMIKNLHNLRIITNLLSGSQTEVQVRAVYSGERLDPTSYFDNVLMLRQTNARTTYKLLHANRDWTSLLLNENPEINSEQKELVFGPVSLSSLTQTPDSVQHIQVRRHILEFLFHSDAITQWKPEPRSILKAKFHCFEKDLNLPNQLIYDQMALQAAASDETKQDELKLPGLGDYSTRQLMYISFAASRCNKAGATNESERSLNHVLQQLDEFADSFSCPIGSPMNPRDKCSIL